MAVSRTLPIGRDATRPRGHGACTVWAEAQEQAMARPLRAEIAREAPGSPRLHVLRVGLRIAADPTYPARRCGPQGTVSRPAPRG
jgi:hypothetical protein